MANLKLVKSATALVLGASVLTSAVAVSGTDASAKTTYKVTKKGTLVNAKTNKAVKGYKSYKGKLYKNGKKLTGTYKSVFYKSGVKFTGTYNKKYYVKGKLFTGKTSKNVYYKKGVKFTGVTSYGYTYKDGKRVEGEYKGKVYKNGKLFTGLYKDVLYTKGEKETGLDLYQDKLYKDGVLNVGLALHEGKLYKDADLNKGLVKHEDKWYNDAEIADGTYDDNGVERAIENGVEVGAKVKSVEAINAKEVKVTFNKTVKAATVEAADFTVTKNNGTPVAISAATDAITVAEDGRSAVITLNAGLSNSDVVKVVVAKDSILTSAYDKFEGATFSDIKFADTQAPKLLSAKATDGTTVELTFDEPVDWTTNIGGISVNGAAQVNGANTTEAGNYTYSFTVSQLKSGANTVQVLNIADFAGNKEALTTTSVDYVADTSIPEVKSIAAEDSNSFIITLNKAVDTVAPANFTVKKGNYTFTSADLSVDYVDANGDASATPTKYVKVTVPTQATTANPLYGTSETSVALSVALSGYKNGTVLGKEYTGSVTLSKDVAAPKVVSSKLITFDKATDKIIVPFDKNITIADGTKLTVVSGSVKVAATAATNGKNLEITITDPAGLTDANYSLVLDKGLVKDGSNNVNEATTLSADVTTAVSTLQLTGAALFGTTSQIDNGKNVITVNYGVGVDDAAAKASSYKLNGSDLPTGSVVYFTSSAKNTVKIELPASYTVGLNNISAKISLNANAVKVADSTSADNGKVISSSTTEAKSVEQVVTLKDNVAPTVTKVEYIKDSATGLATGLKVTFSENVDDSTIDGGTNPTFVIKQGSTNVAYAVAAPAGTDAADDNVLTLNFASGLTLSASNVVLSTSATAADLTLTDLSGNNTIGAISGISAQ